MQRKAKLFYAVESNRLIIWRSLVQAQAGPRKIAGSYGFRSCFFCVLPQNIPLYPYPFYETALVRFSVKISPAKIPRHVRADCSSRSCGDLVTFVSRPRHIRVEVNLSALLTNIPIALPDKGENLPS